MDLSTKKDELNALSGLKTDLESIVNSDIGKIFCSHETIDLMDVIKENRVILASLDGQRFGENAKRIARFLIADIRSCSGNIVSNFDKNVRPEFTLMVDEFADIVDSKELGSMFANLLNRSRSSGIGCVIAHQSFGDFEDERVKTQIVDNTETLFSFVQKDDGSAEKISKMIGTKAAVKHTYRAQQGLFYNRNTGEISKRDTEQFHIHPNRIKNLETGRCVYFAKKPTRYGLLTVRYLDGILPEMNPKKIKKFEKNDRFKAYLEPELGEEMKQKYFKKEEKKKDEDTKTIAIVDGSNEEHMES